jgi:hypothetical protein
MDNIILMHKDTPVAEVMMLGDDIMGVKNIISPQLIPIGVSTKSPALFASYLNSWYKTRGIPKDRRCIEKVESKINSASSEIGIKNLALSLTDCYWFNSNNRFKWSEVNLFDNGFDENFALDVFFDANLPVGFRSPDFATNGCLEKAWMSDLDQPVLIKGGNFIGNAKINDLLSANEIIASNIADLMKLPHVPYFHIEAGGRNLCGCPSFIKDSSVEFISAMQLEKSGLLNFSPPIRLANMIERIGLSNPMNDMYVLDYLIGNTDRHNQNFGILRDSRTLDLIGFAPIFDNGNCLGWNGYFNVDMIDFKPFRIKGNELLKTLDLSRVEIPDINEILNIIDEVYDVFNINMEQRINAKNMIQNSHRNLTVKKY